MTRLARWVVGAAWLVAAVGCASTRTIQTRQDFARLPANQPIRVHAQHDRVYLLRKYALADSFVHGSGTLIERTHSVPFQGDIPLSQIVAITTDSPSVMKTLVLAGVTAVFVAAIVDASKSHTSTPQVGTTYHLPSLAGVPGTSCPYLYAWDGTRYTLQAEPFGIALGRALEVTTWHLLPAVRAQNGVVKLRLSNERRETHFVNSVRAFAIDLGSAPAAVLDVEGTAWPLFHASPPVLALDRSGRDLVPDVSVADGRMWQSDSTALSAGSGYEDVIELTFTRPLHAVAGSLVLTGINTGLSTAIYDQLCRWVGDQTPALAHAVETDPELIAELRGYLRDASLSVGVWDGHAWVDGGSIPPEANAIAFTRALRIGVPEGAGDTVRVRLRSMAGVWQIDALAIDWGDRQPLPMTPLDLVSVSGTAGASARDEIASDDGRYAILVPPDRIDLAFRVGRSAAGGRVAYAVSARGYLMEWDPPGVADRSIESASWLPADRRIESLKAILRHRELALGPAYEEWRRSRTP